MIKPLDRRSVVVLTGTSSYRPALIAFVLTALLLTAPQLLPSLTFMGGGAGGRYVQQIILNLTLPMMFGLPIIGGAIAAFYFTHELSREAHTLLVISGLPDSVIVSGYLLRTLRQTGVLWGLMAGLLIPIWIALYSWHLINDTVYFYVVECLGVFRMKYIAISIAMVGGAGLIMTSGMLLAVLVAFAISLRVPRTSAAVALTLSAALPTAVLSGSSFEKLGGALSNYVFPIAPDLFSELLPAILMLLLSVINLALCAGLYRLLPHLLRREPMV